MKINWIALFFILIVAIMWQGAFAIFGWNSFVGFMSSSIICFILAVSLEAVKIK